jgi:hypothetical protein
MTIENDRTGTLTGSGVTAEGRSSPQRSDTMPTSDTMQTSKEETRRVAATAKEAGKDVVDEETGMTAEVATTAKDEFQRLMGQASTEIKSVGRERGEQIAGRLESLAQQMRAMREGRAEEATELRSWMTQAEQRMQHYASALRQRGPDGALADVRRFARRRPAMFLFAAGVTGFALGRAARAGAMSSHEPQSGGNGDYESNGMYSNSRGTSGDLGSRTEHRAATAVIVEPEDMLPPPTTGSQPERQIP